jgi:ketosteroid isomerase-like protein
MTRFFVLLLAVTGFVFAIDQTDGVREAAQGWRQGTIKQDTALLQRYLADDLVYTHGGGKRQTKAEYIAEVTKGPSHYVSFTESETNIRFFGKIAILTGVVDIKIPKGDPYRVRTFEVYAENNGVWQLAQKESVRVSR